MSNEDILEYGLYKCLTTEEHEYGGIYTTLVPGRNYPEGTLVYKAGNNYEVVNLQKRGTYTIESVNRHDISSEFAANMRADFSYGSFLGFGDGNGKLRAHMSGGQRTIVNITFDNKTIATIEASVEPKWLDVKPGMRVEHYTYKGMNIYKLL